VLTMIALPFFFPGANAIAVFVLGAIPALAFVLMYSILSAAVPRSGGDYVWVGRILGPRWATTFAILFLFSQVVSFTSLNAWLIPTFSLAQLFLSLGILTASPSLISAATAITLPQYGFIISLLVLISYILIGFLGVDFLKRVNRVTFCIFVITTVVFIAGFIMIAQGNYQQSFDSTMRTYNLTYSGVVSSISTNPAFTGFNLTSTLIAFPMLGFLTYSGFNFNTYTAGETRNVTNTIPKSLLYAVVVLLVALVVQSYLAYSALGSLFVGGISYLFNTGALSALPVQPTINFLVSLAIPPWAGALINVNVGIGFFLVGLNTLIMFSRIVFAMGFDRVVPVKLGAVNDKFGSPHNAIMAVGAVAIVFEALYWFAGPGLLAGYLNTSIAVDVAYIIPGLAALILPYYKRDLYNRVIKPLPGWMSMEIAGVPLISIGGLGVVIIWVFGIYTQLIPVSSYYYLGSSIPLASAYTVVPAIIGLAIYELSRAYHKRKDGLDIALAFKEIPPE